ncbi:hypothetical protein BY458DRAFT_516858 [Sporodiniella umbellata]|nr:hypothetical protein BY458DRAFT_516858 [Sporodiniella umbellata]
MSMILPYWEKILYNDSFVSIGESIGTPLKLNRVREEGKVRTGEKLISFTIIGSAMTSLQ